MIDPRTPVLVAAHQDSWRDGGTEPITAMVETTRSLLDGEPAAKRLGGRIDAVRVVGGVWPYRDPGRLVADELGVTGCRTGLTPIGGNEVYDLVTTTAGDVAAGRVDVALVCAAETMRTRRRDRAAGRKSAYRPESERATPDETFGASRPLVDDAQVAAGLGDPVAFYAMAESALRHRRGESLGEHRRRITGLWAEASAVASGDPDAWLQRQVAPDEIATVSERNRMVAAPYTKLLTSNVDVDQSAAVLVCSYEAAVGAGVAADAVVFPVAGTGAADHWSLRARWALDESPAMRIAGGSALALASRTVDDVEDLDLYSCFPVAVQVAQTELGVDPARPFTITGGLTFAGGPFNSYCLHALATAFGRVRDGAASSVLLSGNGGYFTKHSFLVLADEPAGDGFRSARPQAEVDAEPSRPPASAPLRSGRIEAYTVTYERGGEPSAAIVSALDDDGARHWATTDRPDLMAALLDADLVGAGLTARPGSADDVAEVVEVDRA